MSTATFDAEQNQLVVPRAVLLALGRDVAQLDDRERAELQRAGLLTPDGGLTAALAPTAAAVGSPDVTVRVAVAGPDGERAADLWVGGDRAVLHPDAEPGAAAPVVSVGRSLLPQLLVRAAALEARPRGTWGSFAATARDLAAACTQDAAPPWDPAVPAERPRLLALSWAASSSTGSVTVLDLGSGGLWRPAAAAGERAWTWSPTDSATLWVGLGRLFAVALDDEP